MRRVARETTSCRLMASRMAAMSDSTAPSSHAAYIENIVVGRWPCFFAISHGLRPIIRFQLTRGVAGHVRSAIANRQPAELKHAVGQSSARRLSASTDADASDCYRWQSEEPAI